MSAARPDPYDELRAATVGKIERYGYTMTVVGTGDCDIPGCTCGPEPYPYAYSLGFVEHGQPEVVMFGLPLSHVNTLARPVYDAIVAGRPYAVGREHRHKLESGAIISLVPVPDLWLRRDPGRVGGWLDVYASTHRRLPAFTQICWADAAGSMPWEPACDTAVVAIQPVLADDPLRYPRPPRNTARHRRQRRR